MFIFSYVNLYIFILLFKLVYSYMYSHTQLKIVQINDTSRFLEVVVQQPLFSSLLLSYIPGGGSWELVDAFSLCCLTWLFWKILAT